MRDMEIYLYCQLCKIQISIRLIQYMKIGSFIHSSKWTPDAVKIFDMTLSWNLIPLYMI